MATHSWSSSSSWPRSGRLHHGEGAFPLIECPYHLDRRVVMLTAKTNENRGRKFYRCLKGYKSADACGFFMWEDEYEKYLIDNGFAEEENLVRPISVEGNRHLHAHVAELKGTVQQLQNNMVEMQSCINQMKEEIWTLKHHKGSNMSSGSLIVILVAMVVVLGAVVCVALAKLGSQL